MYPDIHILPGFTVSTYFLVISASTIICSLWFLRRAEHRHLDRIEAIDLTIVCLVSGFAGARLLHIFYEEPSFYSQNPLAALKLWEGGFVFLGGLLGSFFAGLIYCLTRNEPFWFWADTATPPIALAYALGRLGCFLNGCCYGKECELPWAVSFDGMIYRHPTQLYATTWEMLFVILLLWLEPRFKTSGVIFNVWLLSHAVGRILMEVFRDDPRGNLILGLSLGIWMSLGLSLLAVLNLVSANFRPTR